jgi:hypothetical protein
MRVHRLPFVVSGLLLLGSAPPTQAEQDKVYLLCESWLSHPSQGTAEVAFSEVDVIDLEKGAFYEAAHSDEDSRQRLTSVSKDVITWNAQGAMFPPDGQWVQFTNSGTVDRNTGVGERITVDGHQRVLEYKRFKCISGTVPF